MGLVNQIKNWFRTPFDHEQALMLYRSIVEQSRRPEFYGEVFAVADTADGRYDLIAMHSFLVMRRLKDSGPEAVDLSQALHDLMFADMDQNLREMGIGDHGLPKRMKKLAEGFRGRIAAYEDGLTAAANSGYEILNRALRRNLYRKSDPSDMSVNAMVDYMASQDQRLRSIPTEDLLRGKVSFNGPGMLTS